MGFKCNRVGFIYEIFRVEEKLFRKLINDRLVQIDEYGGLTVLPNNLAAISPKYGELDTLHIHGVLISGVILRNNSAKVIQETAHNVIKILYK